MKKMLITGSDKLLPECVRLLEKSFAVDKPDHELDEAESAELLEKAEIYVLGGDELVTEKALSRSAVKTVIFIGAQWETSFTVAAKKLLQEREISVYATGGGLMSVVETTVKLVADPNLIRSMGAKRGIWQGDYEKLAAGMKVVIFGAGHIGARVASELKQIFPNTSYFYSSREHPELEARGIKKIIDADEAFRETDIACVHLAYVEGVTDDIVTPERIKLMSKNGLLVNMARAQLIKDVNGYAEVVTSELNRQHFFDVFWVEGMKYQELFDFETEEAFIATGAPEYAKALKVIATSPNFHLYCHAAAVSDKEIAAKTHQEYSENLLAIIAREKL